MAEESTAVPQVSTLRLRVAMEACGSGRTQPYHGSMLRGAFGHSLRRMVCLRRWDDDCRSCSLASACPYPKLFAPLRQGEPPPFRPGMVNPPRPYLFEPHEEREVWRPGDRLGFDLILVGQAQAERALAEAALDRMARVGLGSERLPFRCLSVKPIELPLPVLRERATLRLLTPLRIMHRKHPLRQLGLRQLVHAMAQRLEDLAWCYGDRRGPWESRPLLRHADRLEVRSTLRWRSLQRWSARQQEKVPLSGVEGELRLRGELGPLVPLLRAMEALHVGKGTVHGLGRVAIQG